MVQGVLRMNMMLKTAGVAVLGAGLLLSGCVPTETLKAEAVAKAPMPPAEIMAEATNARLAQAIAAACPFGFGYNDNHEDEVKSGLKRVYGNTDVVPDWASDASARKVHQDFDTRGLPNYMARRHIKQDDRDSWCAAGKAEIAGKTAIGKYLIAR
jgi:hypothetical protein